jgi:hypothetical protein
MQIKETIKKTEVTGVVDGPHYEFDCSKCGAPLADLWVTAPDADITWNFVAECCHCGDRSYAKEVKGAFSAGSSERSAKYTIIEDYDYSSDPIVIKTHKVKQYEQERC